MCTFDVDQYHGDDDIAPLSFERVCSRKPFTAVQSGHCTLYNTQYTTNIAQYTTLDTEHQIIAIIPSIVPSIPLQLELMHCANSLAQLRALPTEQLTCNESKLQKVKWTPLGCSAFCNRAAHILESLQCVPSNPNARICHSSSISQTLLRVFSVKIWSFRTNLEFSAILHFGIFLIL